MRAKWAFKGEIKSIFDLFLRAFRCQKLSQTLEYAFKIFILYKLFNCDLIINLIYLISWFTAIIIANEDRMREYIAFCLYIPAFFFLLGSSFTNTDDSQDSRGREGDHLLFLSTTFARSRIFRQLQLCIWDDYHVFLIAPLAFTRLLLDGIYNLVGFAFDWLMIEC